MHRLIALALAAIPSTAIGQSAVPIAPIAGGTDCAAFIVADGASQIAMLQAIQPLGDAIDAADEAAARAWAGEVSAACADHPDRPLSEAAAAALGGD